MRNFMKFTWMVVAVIAVSTSSKAQLSIGNTGDEYLNTVTTAVPFLRITPDARSGGMADVGIAISPDANSIFWNASKIVFIDDAHPTGISLTYTPWLKNNNYL